MTSPPKRLVVFSALALGLSGCMTAAKVFFDIPEGQGSQGDVAPGAEISPELLEQLQMKPPPLPPPAIESVTDPDSVLALLPSDRSGGVDWGAAVRQGVIRPRESEESTEADTVGAFSYDLYLSSGAGPQAYFPHSVHSFWLDCRSCHPKVFSGSGSVTGATAHTEAACGYCHGRVAFSAQACERCHESFSALLPEGRIDKTFGTVMKLGEPEEFAGADVSGFPAPVFPHDQHRLRFQCKACHERLFPMATGVESVEQAHSGSGCGRCHDGATAFAIDPSSCNTCHVPDTG